MAAPVVSVLIASYNYAKYLPECIDSVLCQQTDVPLEIILTDDGSTDNTEQIAKRYPLRYFYQPHMGVAAARNRCLAESRGQWVAFIDADDMWTTDKLQLQLEMAQRHLDHDIVFCGVRNFIDPTKTHNDLFHLCRPSENVASYLIPALIKRSLLQRFSGFDEQLLRGEDTAFLVRIRNAGVPMDLCVDKQCYLRRLHGSNLTIQVCDERKLMADILRRELNAKKGMDK